MRHLVHLEYVVVAKGFSAHVAFIGFFSCVGTDVNLQLLGAGETFLAVFTGVWLLSSVGSHVDHELTRLHESLSANLE